MDSLLDADDVERCLRCYGDGQIVCPTTAGPGGGVGGMTLTMFTCPECGGTGLRPVGWWQPNVPEVYAFHLKCPGTKYVVQDMDGLHPRDHTQCVPVFRKSNG